MTLRYTEEERATLAEARKLRQRRIVAEKTRIVLPPRPSVSPARKARLHALHGGVCHVCKAPLPVLGPTVQYDHIRERGLEGSDTDDNVAPICTTPCHAKKTAQFLSLLAHLDRAGSKHRGEKKPGQKIPSAPFPIKRKLDRLRADKQATGNE